MSQYTENWALMYEYKIKGRALDLDRVIKAHAMEVAKQGEKSFTPSARKLERSAAQIEARCRRILDDAERTGELVKKYQACLAEAQRVAA